MREFLKQYAYLMYTLLAILFALSVAVEGGRFWEGVTLYPFLAIWAFLMVFAGVLAIIVSRTGGYTRTVILESSDRTVRRISYAAVGKILRRIASQYKGLNLTQVHLQPSEAGLVVDLKGKIRNSDPTELTESFTLQATNVLESALGVRVAEMNFCILKATLPTLPLEEDAPIQKKARSHHGKV